MPLVVRAFPLLPGKAEALRRFAADMAGPRRQEAEQFFKSFGVVRESWHYQETPQGPMVIAVTDVESEPGARAWEYAESSRPFDRWFKDQVRDLTGIDPSVHPLGPSSEVIFDTQREATVHSPTH
jgi:hypothetical protein